MTFLKLAAMQYEMQVSKIGNNMYYRCIIDVLYMHG